MISTSELRSHGLSWAIAAADEIDRLRSFTFPADSLGTAEEIVANYERYIGARYGNRPRESHAEIVDLVESAMQAGKAAGWDEDLAASPHNAMCGLSDPKPPKNGPRACNRWRSKPNPYIEPEAS